MERFPGINKQGEIHALIGDMGAGKTTLAKQLRPQFDMVVHSDTGRPLPGGGYHLPTSTEKAKIRSSRAGKILAAHGAGKRVLIEGGGIPKYPGVVPEISQVVSLSVPVQQRRQQLMQRSKERRTDFKKDWEHNQKYKKSPAELRTLFGQSVRQANSQAEAAKMLSKKADIEISEDPMKMVPRLRQIHKLGDFPTGAGPEDWDAMRQSPGKVKRAAGLLGNLMEQVPPVGTVPSMSEQYYMGGVGTYDDDASMPLEMVMMAGPQASQGAQMAQMANRMAKRSEEKFARKQQAVEAAKLQAAQTLAAELKKQSSARLAELVAERPVLTKIARESYAAFLDELQKEAAGLTPKQRHTVDTYGLGGATVGMAAGGLLGGLAGIPRGDAASQLGMHLGMAGGAILGGISGAAMGRTKVRMRGPQEKRAHLIRAISK